MEPDKVDTAVEPFQQADQPFGMAEVVVDATEHGVFERYAPLSAPVILLKQCDDVGNGIGFLHGHNGQSLFGKRVVEADGQVALAFVEETPKARNDSDA